MSEESSVVSRDTDLIDRVWMNLRSMRFALWILVLITLASIFNLFATEFIVPVEEGGTMARAVYSEAYGPVRAAILSGMQMYRPYRSWWYTGLLGLLMLSLIACVIDRTGSTYRGLWHPRFIRNREGYRSGTVLKYPGDAGEFAERLSRVFGKAGFRTWRSEEAEGILLHGKKNAVSSIGPWLVHVGFIFLLLGGAMIARATYSTRVSGLPGDLLAPDETIWGFNVRVDDFEIEYYPVDEGQLVEVDTHAIGRVISRNGDGTFDIQIYQPRPGEESNVEPERVRNKIDRHMGGGRIDQANIADYIATLTVLMNGEPVLTDRVEVNHPLRYNGYRFYQSSFDDRRRDDDGRWTTILQVKRDRGSTFVWVGLLLVSCGLILGFYLVPKQLFARVERRNGISEAVIIGRARRGESLFQREFERLVKDLHTQGRPS